MSIAAKTAGADSHAHLDVNAIRAEFPILDISIRGKPLVYLDNAATSQKPRAVIGAIMRYYEGTNANVHRGVHHLSEAATEDYEARVSTGTRARRRAARTSPGPEPPVSQATRGHRGIAENYSLRKRTECPGCSSQY